MSVAKIAQFWSTYRRSRLGLVGLTILASFLLVSISAPALTPYDPIRDRDLAEGAALPAWYKVLPQYADLPGTRDFVVNPEIGVGNWELNAQGDVKPISRDPVTLALQSVDGRPGVGTAELTHRFAYQYAPPLSFQINMGLDFVSVIESTYQLELFVINPESEPFLIWDGGPNSRPLEPSRLDLDSKGLPFEYKSKMGLQWYQNVAERIFAKKGLYSLVLRIHAKGVSKDSDFKISLNKAVLHVPGRVHGVLGTDHLGSDLFSQLLYGTRVSLLIGVSAAMLSVSIGLAVGLISGYQGGLTDEVSMRMVDVLLVLPGLPMLMILSGLFGRNIWNIIFLLGILSWPGFARVVRAQVLQLKTVSFVEASRAIGSSSHFIIIRHLLPNVLPLAYATIALYIPGAVITEAALSFLALGDPNTSSWGRMFYSANAFGAFQHLAWWWIVPPGIAITLLSLSFVFIGTTLDEVLNPRIRARR